MLAEFHCGYELWGWIIMVAVWVGFFIAVGLVMLDGAFQFREYLQERRDHPNKRDNGPRGNCDDYN